MARSTPDLFDWQPKSVGQCYFLPFPLDRRIGKVRDVAEKMLTKTTDKHLASYHEQVSLSLRNQMEKIGLSESDQDAQLAAFWRAVQIEVARRSYRARKPSGTA